jgi:hypothetical protein
MANQVTPLNYANTFGDWVATTNQLVAEANTLAAGNYTKDAGTLFVQSSGIGLQVANNAVVQGTLSVAGTGSSATIQNALTVQGQIFATNSSGVGLVVTNTANIANVNILGAGTGLFVANNTSLNGDVALRSSIFKNERIYCTPQQSAMGISAPAAPVLSIGSQSAGSTSYKAGDVVKYIAQSCSQNGRSFQSNELSVVITADGNNVILNITPAANFTVEYYQVFALNPGEVFQLTSDGLPNHKLIGKLVAARQGVTPFVDARAILPGFNAAVFLPKAANRAQLAVLGPRISRIDYGVRGLAQEFGYVSYLAYLLKLPRQHGLLTNVLEEIE